MTYITQLANARSAAYAARKAVVKAEGHVAPPTAEMHALFMDRPEQYAQCLRKMADILVTLPSLREAAESAEKIFSELETLACHRCHGTGRYDGPTSATRNGVPYCFYCDGTGKAK